MGSVEPCASDSGRFNPVILSLPLVRSGVHGAGASLSSFLLALGRLGRSRACCQLATRALPRENQPEARRGGLHPREEHLHRPLLCSDPRRPRPASARGRAAMAALLCLGSNPTHDGTLKLQPHLCRPPSRSWRVLPLRRRHEKRPLRCLRPSDVRELLV